MGTIRKLSIGYRVSGIGRACTRYPIPDTRYRLPLLFCLPLLLTLSACSSVRPVAKIGLIAPFEGVYRQEGYDALAAMRAAIAETDAGGIDVLPLALDSSRGVVRTAQKALVDPAVAGVIGPYWPADGDALGSWLAQGRWLRPYAPTGADDGWAALVLNRVRAHAQAEGRTLLLAGSPEGWPLSPQEVAQEPETVQPGQTVLWLGDATAGAAFALAVWEENPDTPFGLYAAGSESFRARLGGPMRGPVFLAGWVDDGYDAWAESHSPATPAAYIVYRQSVDLLAGLAGAPPHTQWRPQIFALEEDGSLRLLPEQ